MAARANKENVRLDASMRLVVLHGRERYLLTERTRQLVGLLEEEHGDLMQFTFDGSTATPAEILDELRSYGLLGGHKLVILDQADQFLAREGHRPLMERYAASPVESATLLLRAETWRPGRLDKLIQAAGAINKCDALTAAKARDFCIRRCAKRYDAEIAPDAAAALVSLTGTDLARLDTEVAKLAAFVGSGQTVSREDVARLVGISREEQGWAIQEAIAGGDPAEACAKVRELLEISRVPEALIAWAIMDLLRKIHAAAAMLAQGQAPGQVASALRLWGEARNLIPAAARRLGPDRAAQLLQEALATDMRTKTGLGRAARSLEALTILVTDTLRCEPRRVPA